jgi:hypothetical protein
MAVKHRPLVIAKLLLKRGKIMRQGLAQVIRALKAKKDAIKLILLTLEINKTRLESTFVGNRGQLLSKI